MKLLESKTLSILQKVYKTDLDYCRLKYLQPGKGLKRVAAEV